MSGFENKLLRTAVIKDTGQNQATDSHVESFGTKNCMDGQNLNILTHKEKVSLVISAEEDEYNSKLAENKKG